MDNALLTDDFLDDHLDLPCTRERAGPYTNMKTGQRWTDQTSLTQNDIDLKYVKQ